MSQKFAETPRPTPGRGRGRGPSVVIPARNAARTLADCLAAVVAQCPPPLEVIVVDDASSDATASVARAHGATVLTQPGRGPAAARNAGARAARGELLVFVDADCVPEPGCLAALLAPFADPEVAGVRGAYLSRQRALVARFAQLELEEKQDRMAAASQVTLVDTACAAYRRSLFLDSGGFDESFRAPSVEDAELSFRLAAAGARLVYAPGARVEHHHPTGLPRYLLRKARFGYHRASLYRRYPERLVEDGYTPRLMPLQIVLAGLLAGAIWLSPWSARARRTGVLLSLAFLASALPLTLRALRTDPPLALATPALLLARSTAQGLGLAAGLAHPLIQRARRNSPSPAGRGFG